MAANSEAVMTAVRKQNEVLGDAVYNMKKVLAESLKDPVKISIAKNKVEQARLKAELEYMRSCMGPVQEVEYTKFAADRISDLLSRRVEEAHIKKHSSIAAYDDDTNGIGSPVPPPRSIGAGPNTLLRRAKSQNEEASQEVEKANRMIAAKEAEIARKKQEMARAEAERSAAATQARLDAEAAAAAAAITAKTGAATADTKSKELQEAAMRKAELDKQKADQAARLQELMKQEQALQRATELEQARQREHELKLLEVAKAAEQKKAAEVEERRERAEAEKAAAKKAAALEADRKRQEEAARAVKAEEEAIKNASKDDDLSEWHGTSNALKITDEERRRQIEEAERQAILEVEGGSVDNNDDAILRAMRRTNPDAYEQTIKSRPSVSFADAGHVAAKQQVREQMGIDTMKRGSTMSRGAGANKVALADADYLLSMIQNDVDEESELKDKTNGARYHVNGSGEKVYRLGDLPADEAADYGGNGVVADIPVPTSTDAWSTTTLERRTKNLSDVERRRAAAEARKKEAWARSMERNKGKNKSKSKSRKGKTSETQF